MNKLNFKLDNLNSTKMSVNGTLTLKNLPPE